MQEGSNMKLDEVTRHTLECARQIKDAQNKCEHYRDSVVVVGRTAAVCVDCGKIFG